MSIEALKQKIQSRAFWERSTEKSMLPDRNMTRSRIMLKNISWQEECPKF